MPQQSQPLPTSLSPDRLDNWRGVSWMLISVVGAAIMSLAVKFAATELDSRAIVLVRAGVTTALLLLALIIIARWRAELRFSRPWAHILRGALIGVSTHMGFYALTQIPLATATVLFFTGPIFATVFGVIFHGEGIGLRRVLAILAGFTGALVILRPGLQPLDIGMVLALGSSILFAASLTMVRGLANRDGALSTYFSSVVITALISAPVAFSHPVVPQSFWVGVALALVVAGSITRGIADIQAYRFAEAAILAPFAYLRLVLIGLGAYLLFAELPDTPTYIGAAIIIGATLYIARREAQLRKRG